MRLTFWILSCLIALTLTACNTVQGMGQDLEAAGNAIGDVAEDAEDD